MALKKLLSATKKLEDPEYPLLGPALKGLYFFGLWQTGTKFRTVTYNIFHFTTFLFFCSQAVDLYMVRHDLNQVLTNMSVTALSIICVMKCFSYVLCQKEWRELIESISLEEKRLLMNPEAKLIELMKGYTKYTRVITYLFWVLVFFTNFLLIVTPVLEYASSKTYREEIRRGVEPLPQIMCSWFPFDNKKMPGYFWGICVHILMGSQGSGVLATYDMTAVAIMTYLKGQMRILNEKCRVLFNGANLTEKDVVDRIKECHRHHNVLVKQYKDFDDLLSPNMFLYVILCSTTICCSVVQFNSSDANTSQKLWVIQYSVGLVSQLFLYCWHSNEVAIESSVVDRGVYESDWWKGDKKSRRLVLLLAAKLDQIFILNAGPYTTLSLPTFINILKGSYSFFTLFSQMQEENINSQ